MNVLEINVMKGILRKKVTECEDNYISTKGILRKNVTEYEDNLISKNSVICVLNQILSRQ
jgi:hypothetical protein